MLPYLSPYFSLLGEPTGLKCGELKGLTPLKLGCDKQTFKYYMEQADN